MNTQMFIGPHFKARIEMAERVMSPRNEAEISNFLKRTWIRSTEAWLLRMKG